MVDLFEEMGHMSDSLSSDSRWETSGKPTPDLSRWIWAWRINCGIREQWQYNRHRTRIAVPHVSWRLDQLFNSMSVPVSCLFGHAERIHGFVGLLGIGTLLWYRYRLVTDIYAVYNKSIQILNVEYFSWKDLHFDCRKRTSMLGTAIFCSLVQRVEVRNALMNLFGRLWWIATPMEGALGILWRLFYGPRWVRDASQ